MATSHHESQQCGVFRFDADIGAESVSAFISHAALRARYGGTGTEADLRRVVSQYRLEIDAAIERRIQAGAREPVVLRVSDLCPPSTVGFVASCCGG